MIQHGDKIQLGYEIGPDQKGFLEFFERALAPGLASAFGESVRGR